MWIHICYQQPDEEVFSSRRVYGLDEYSGQGNERKNKKIKNEHAVLVNAALFTSFHQMCAYVSRFRTFFVFMFNPSEHRRKINYLLTGTVYVNVSVANKICTFIYSVDNLFFTQKHDN